MKTVLILESGDAVHPTDWCRPLEIDLNGSSKNVYSGKPENNAKWVKVREIFGEPWWWHPVAEINKEMSPHEFARGDIPNDHLL